MNERADLGLMPAMVLPSEPQNELRRAMMRAVVPIVIARTLKPASS